MDLELDLDLDLGQSVDFTDTEDIVYPCLLISNILDINTLKLLKSLNTSPTRQFPSWVSIDNEFVNVGSLSLTFETIQMMRQLQVSCILYTDSKSPTLLDMNDINTFLKVM